MTNINCDREGKVLILLDGQGQCLTTYTNTL